MGCGRQFSALKHLPHKHENWSLAPQTHIKLDVVIESTTPECLQWDGRQKQEKLWTQGVLNNKRSFIKKGERQGPTPEVVLSGPRKHNCMHLWIITHKWTCTFKHYRQKHSNFTKLPNAFRSKQPDQWDEENYFISQNSMLISLTYFPSLPSLPQRWLLSSWQSWDSCRAQ